MSIYLPIAEMPINALLVILASGLVGFLSGLVGVGGGFVLTPILIFLGVPPPVAVATQASQISASSISGLLAHARRGGVDLRLGLVLSIGGVIGGWIGVEIFERALEAGQIDLMIAALYIVVCGVVGTLMLVESLIAIRRGPEAAATSPRPRSVRRPLPFQLHFETSGRDISVIPLVAIGAAVGILAAIMGIGGGFLLTPALIYLLRLPTRVVIGTSLLHVLIVTALVTILQSVQTQTVDLVLAALLMLGGVLGAQVGARVGARMRAEHLRAVLGLIVLATGLKLFSDLVVQPAEIFTLDVAPP